jgi:GNAT superfamily N-acetyltransferase
MILLSGGPQDRGFLQDRMDLTFKLATRDDEELLVQLMRQLREDDPDEGEFIEANARAAIPDLLADRSLGGLWLIRADDETAGYVALTLGYSLEFGGRIAFVDELLVRRLHRRKGIGRRALEFAEKQAKALGVRVLLLEVTQSNSWAKALYEKSGFTDRTHQLMTKKIE